MFNALKTRSGKLKNKLSNNFLNKKLTDKDIDDLISVIENYEKVNLSSIDKLKKDKAIESKRISGALKQTINAHGVITKELIGSATKRIMGALLADNNDKKFIKLHIGNALLILILTIIFISFIIII
jgi:hypothetical protein